MRQRWLNLLFAHYALDPEAVRRLIPAGLELDTFEGKAWLGVVPFSMDQVQVRVAGSSAAGVPTVRAFDELNLRTYVRSPRTGLRGVYFFSLDCSSLLAVIGARVGFHLPYFPAAMQVRSEGDAMSYASRRSIPRGGLHFSARYGPAGKVFASRAGSLEAFLTERYCLFTASRGRILRGDIHHRQWPLQPAWAEIAVDEIPAAHGMELPAGQRPVLHFSRMLEVYLWLLVSDGAH